MKNLIREFLKKASGVFLSEDVSYFVSMEIGLGNEPRLFCSRVVTAPRGTSWKAIIYDASLVFSESVNCDMSKVKVTAFNRI